MSRGKTYWQSRTVRRASIGAVVAVLSYIVSWASGQLDWDWRVLAGVAAGALLTAIGAISGRRSNPLDPLRLRKPRPPRAASIIAIVGLAGLLIGSCGGQLSSLSRLGASLPVPIAVSALRATGCQDVEVDVTSDYRGAPDLRVAADAVEGVMRAMHGASGSWERDLVRVVVRGCGLEMSAYVAVGLDVGPTSGLQ